MILSKHPTPHTRATRRTAFTIIEVMVASAIGLMLLAGAYVFLIFALRALSGISAQTVLNQKAGNTLEKIQARVRFATTNSASSSGNTLTLAFDDNYTVDSDSNGRTYDDRNHYEQFKFIGNNSTNASDCLSNMLVYIPNTNSSAQQILVATGVRNLPGYKIFSVTNGVIVVVRFGITDTNAADHFQGIDVQGAAVSLNRLWNTNIITIIP